jgi:hypothetical protein
MGDGNMNATKELKKLRKVRDAAGLFVLCELEYQNANNLTAALKWSVTRANAFDELKRLLKPATGAEETLRQIMAERDAAEKECMALRFANQEAHDKTIAQDLAIRRLADAYAHETGKSESVITEWALDPEAKPIY